MIAVGMHVDIQRSDGRIHGAVIAEIRQNGRYMVEWYEKGDTKGKETSIEELLKLNPTLQPAKPQIPKCVDDDEDTFLLADLKKVKSREPSLFKAPNENILGPKPSRNRETAPKRTVMEPIASIPSAPVVQQVKQTKIVEKKVEVVRPAAREPPVPVQITRRDPSPVEPRAPSPTLVPKSYPQQEVNPSSAHFAFAEMIRNFRKNIDYRPLNVFDTVNENRISVCVRKRPLNKKEFAKGEVDVITTPSRDIVVLHQPQVRVDLTKYLDNQKFRFDYTFDETADNELVYKFTAQPLVNTIFENGNATCFAYGQTGSGKTHTMGGDFSGKKQNSSMGIYALTARDVFRTLDSPQYRKKGLSVYCAFFEIYGSKVFDLLNDKNQLRVLEDQQQKVQIVGLKEVNALGESDVLELIDKGSLVRSAGTTSANANSSRSHAVFQIILKQGKKSWGKFSLIDLAGNERGQDTRECGRDTRKEGADINMSLLALKECIRGMARNSSHVAFRQSKLTMVLRDSFIGEKSRTVMISMISPGISSSEHTLNTLRYADRVKEMGADGSGEATPIRDEEIFLPPKNSDEEEEEDEQDDYDGEKIQSINSFVDLTGKLGKDLMNAKNSSLSPSQTRDVLSKLDQLAHLTSKLRSAIENGKRVN